MEEPVVLRKHLPLDELIQYRQQIEDVDYWRGINPHASISDFPVQALQSSRDAAVEEAERYATRLREEGYFQTPPILPAAMVQEMRACIEAVKERGFPVMFSLVYDVFYSAFAYFDAALAPILGPGYKLIPNFWVYYVEPSDAGKGFEPHRDAEYEGTIGADGMPTVLTLWVTVTDATPLNSCMYVVPRNRGPQYERAIHDLETGGTEFNLEDIRALPTKAGALSCWDQYLFHWGSRSSKRAPAPRISYAMYCQRGDTPPVDDASLDLRHGIDFNTRLGAICRGMYRYSYLSIKVSEQSRDLLSFLGKHMAVLAKS